MAMNRNQSAPLNPTEDEAREIVIGLMDAHCKPWMWPLLAEQFQALSEGRTHEIDLCIDNCGGLYFAEPVPLPAEILAARRAIP